jgi:hypothetical protein
MYPTALSTQADVEVQYTNSNVFKLNTLPFTTAVCYINGVNTYAIPTKVISVGVDLGAASVQGSVGYDEGKFDQGVLALPQGLSIDTKSGWLTGYLPTQTINEINYEFDITVYKRDYPGYAVSKQFELRVLGDINNTINWVTPAYLGSIENGAISAFSVFAESSKGKNLYYDYAVDSLLRLPQGLVLLNNGTISGRVSFEVFCLDSSQTIIDSGTTTFDNTYKFSITASDFDQTISATREFIIKVIQRNITPYENLYLKALLSREQRSQLQDILQDKTIFPLDCVYRNEDPYYGLAKDIKTLFLPGLTPSLLSTYANTVVTNHFTKRITFGEVKTAVAVDGSYNVVEVNTGINIGTYQDNVGFIPTDLSLGYTASSTLPAGTVLDGEHVKYEVVYLDIIDDNTHANSAGTFGPSNTINLQGQINPYYDINGAAYDIAYPNAFNNMNSIMVQGIGYVNKGALPDWMTSKQPDGRVLGFTRAVVLAYVIPGTGNSTVYNYKQAGYNLNEIDFTVDRYQLDNNFSTNYNILANAFIQSKETTFDRYPALSSTFTAVGTVDYAVTISYEVINKQAVASINSLGGLDGITGFADGETIVFYNQEFQTGIAIGDQYNQGWSNVASSWGVEPWDDDKGTVTSADDLGWDAAKYIPGSNEHLLDPAVPNQRSGIWKINIDADDIVQLTFVQTVDYYNTLFVRNGFTHGGTNIYYDPIIKSGLTIPNYSVIPQQINIVATTFDGGGTKFLNYRDSYSVPEQGDKYIKFAKTGVFI